MTINTHPAALARIRPFDNGDLVAVHALFDRWSDESTYQRFFSTSRRLASDYADDLADPDRTMFAAVAVDGSGTVIGVGSLHRASADQAEFGLAVDDSAQGGGVGTRLLAAVLQYAYRSHLPELIAYVQPDNRAMLRMIAVELPDATLDLHDGAVCVAVSVSAAVHNRFTHLTQEVLSWTAEGSSITPRGSTVHGGSGHAALVTVAANRLTPSSGSSSRPSGAA